MQEISYHNDGKTVEMIIDAHDKKLLALLRENSRASIAELSRVLGLSRSTVKDRINRLEEKRVIQGYSLILNDELTRGHVSAHVMVKLESGKPTHAIRHLRQIRQISTAYAISGTYDLIVVVEAESTGELDTVLDTIRGVEGINDTLTSVVLSTKFSR